VQDHVGNEASGFAAYVSDAMLWANRRIGSVVTRTDLLWSEDSYIDNKEGFGMLKDRMNVS
jgi:hypothetical protein